MSYNLPDRRIARRVYVKVPLACEFMDPVEHKIKTKTFMSGNISESGLYFESDELLPLKTEFKAAFKIPKNETPIAVSLRVARVETTDADKFFGIGASFIEIKESDRQLIIQMTERLDIRVLLDYCIKRGASDLHLLADSVPVLRIQGELELFERPRLTPDEVAGLIYSIMSRPQIKKFEMTKELDFGLQYDVLNRFRVNLHVQRGFMEATFRLITVRTFDFDQLKIPEVVKDLSRLKDGLIIVAGPTGSGKSTTIAAMVELINQERKVVIITLERPIEYVHTNIKSIIKQREVGVDTSSFSVALQSSLRQDPNVIVVGELDDIETVKTALVAAEAGYLVIASFHAPNTIHAIDRITSIFPPENRKQILAQLSNCLKGIVTQLLLPTADRKGRCLAAEILVSNDAVKRIIRNDDLVQLANTIQTGSHYRMQGMVDAIKHLVEQGVVDADTAKLFCQEFGTYHHDTVAF